VAISASSRSGVPKSRSASMTSHTSSAVPMTHGLRFQSPPRKAIPGNRRARSASSASDSSTEALLRRVRCASLVISASSDVSSRRLKG
jgi:hypothetical protein